MIFKDIISNPFKIGKNKFITNFVLDNTKEINFNFENLKESLKLVNNFLESQKSYIHKTCVIEKNVEMEGNIYLDEGVKVLSGSKLSGNIYIGKNSTIYNNVLVRGNTSIGDNSIIGFSTDIKNVLASNNFLVGPICFISDSIIGTNCFFGGCCRTGNYRFDNQSPNLKHRNKIIPTQLDKFGLIVGDNSKFGMSVISMPGRIVGSNCIVGSQVQIVKNIPSNKKVFLKQNLEITEIE